MLWAQSLRDLITNNRYISTVITCTENYAVEILSNTTITTTHTTTTTAKETATATTTKINKNNRTAI